MSADGVRKTLASSASLRSQLAKSSRISAGKWKRRRRGDIWRQGLALEPGEAPSRLGASRPGYDIYAHENAGKGVDGTITYPGKRVLQRQREFRVLRPFVNRRGISHAKHEAQDSPVLFAVRSRASSLRQTPI